MKSKYKLATRKSLLAWAQSSWVARRLEALNPGISVELVGIETRGDRILDVSLQSVAGKEFFVAELDDALVSGAVDLTVHSMKDLSLDRPKAFVCAAIPRRENPRDVVLLGPGVLEKLSRGQALRIGTSSPRRLVNIPPFLERALPTVSGHAPKVELVEIRGNVNTRLSRVHEPAGSDRALDAVVLAFAGLIRLWKDEAGQKELRKLLSGVRWMVLPLRECPAAPAQGALAVECRAADAETRAMIAKLHDAETATRVARERQLLADWGGGCHQKFGATCIGAENGLGDLLYVRGEKPDGEFVDELRWKKPADGAKGETWDGAEWRAKSEAPVDGTHRPISSDCVFVAHSRAVPRGGEDVLRSKRVWTSGRSSWERLAARGVWVEGCAESLGFEFLGPTLEEGVLQLAPASGWTVLTHQAGAADWNGRNVVATYTADGSYDDRARAALRGAREIFWSSGSQFDELKSEASKEARHACGPGKTAARLRASGIEPLVFPSVEEWRSWVRKSEVR